MKSTITGMALGAILALSGGAAYSAVQSHAAGWPVSCAGLRCVNVHLNDLNERLARTESQIAHLWARNKALLSCLAEYPVTRYGTSDNYTIPFYNNQLSNAGTAPGYFNDYNWYAQFFQYLGPTQSGDTVDHWFLRDTCTPSVFGPPPAP